MTQAAEVSVRALAKPFLGLVLAGCLPVFAAESPADTTAESGTDDWAAAQLARMAAALDDLDYEGTLVYLADNHLETLHLVHRVIGSEVAERLVSLSGPVRALARRQDEVTCTLSGDRPISVKRRAAMPDLLHAHPIDPAMLAENYFVHPLGETRVAGRDTDVLGVIPRDSYRYGYRFYLDRQTGLPLKSDLMGTGGEPIEQVMFATVKFGHGELKSTAAESPSAAGATASSAVAVTSVDRTAPSTWHFDTLPPGFALRMHDTWPEGPGGTGGPVEHLLVTDHLAAVSVFVEAPGQGGLNGASRIGAVHAIGERLAGHQVTVVGQVPAETVAAVLAGLRYDGGVAR